MSHFIIKDAFWQILGRLLSALGGFVVIKLMTPYLGPLRFGDYSTILKYFAIRSALADFGLYVLAIKKLGEIKKNLKTDIDATLSDYYSRFVTSRLVMIVGVYSVALCIAYLIPSYTSNPYLVYGLPIGMLFSASFMIAGILQLPVQLYAQMQHTTIALTIARIVQIVCLIMIVWYLYPHYSASSMLPSGVFVMILGSVVASGIAQGLYVWRASSRYIKLQRIRDPVFTWTQLSSNRKYGFAYYLSSFHTLIVVIVLSIFFPTVNGWIYVGIWAFALQLMELALIIPSSMANSLLHKLGDSDLTHKKQSFGALLNLIVWIAAMCFANFLLFAQTWIHIIGGDQYLSTVVDGRWQAGSDFILPFLGIVLILSFVKQIFNYIFVSCDLHNKIFAINLIGVIVGCVCGIPLMYYYNILGGIATQLILELCFVVGAIVLAYRHDCLPHLGSWAHRSWVLFLSILTIVFFYATRALGFADMWLYVYIFGFNIFALIFSYSSIRKILTTLKSIT